MQELIKLDNVETLTNKYWECEAREKRDAYNLISVMVEKGEILRQIKVELGHGNWIPWLREQDISQANAWRYMHLAENKERLISNHSPANDFKPVTSVKEALKFLETPPRNLEEELQELQADFVNAVNRVGRIGLRIRDFLEEFPDTRVPVTADFPNAMDLASTIVNELRERMYYDVSEE